MVTPYRNNKIDYPAVDQILDYYMESGCPGVFAVCTSSEIQQLSLEERIELSKHIVDYVDHRMIVVASGHVSDSLEDQAKELNEIAKTGVDVIVIITNRLDSNQEGDDVLIENGEKLLKHLDPNIKLGMYESPIPYKRLLTPKIINWMKAKNRFYFIKDTCCDIDMMKERIDLMKGSTIKLYNANGQTLRDSMLLGAAGYSGIMSNFICKQTVELCNNLDERLGTEVAFFSFIESKAYPATGKYALSLHGIDLTLECRKPVDKITEYEKELIRKMIEFYK